MSILFSLSPWWCWSNPGPGPSTDKCSATEEHRQTLNTFLPDAQIQEGLTYSFQLLKFKKKCCVPTHSLCLGQLIFSAGDWIYSLHSLGECYKLSYILFPCPLWKFCGKCLTEFPSWLEFALSWWWSSTAPGVAGITVLYHQAWRSESFKYKGDCVGLFQFVHHCSVQCCDVSKNKTVAVSWM